jgi:tRNA threonylcarbamoyladenosine modification (KEOPS) complex  Pcc1 subunit
LDQASSSSTRARKHRASRRGHPVVHSANATISIDLPSRRLAEAILAALKPEVERPPTRRCLVTASVVGSSLALKLEAVDTSALRAAANSYLRWIKTLDRTLALDEGSQP